MSHTYTLCEIIVRHDPLWSRIVKRINTPGRLMDVCVLLEDHRYLWGDPRPWTLGEARPKTMPRAPTKKNRNQIPVATKATTPAETNLLIRIGLLLLALFRLFALAGTLQLHVYLFCTPS
jgi:hypothetical protein